MRGYEARDTGYSRRSQVPAECIYMNTQLYYKEQQRNGLAEPSQSKEREETIKHYCFKTLRFGVVDYVTTRNWKTNPWSKPSAALTIHVDSLPVTFTCPTKSVYCRHGEMGAL